MPSQPTQAEMIVAAIQMAIEAIVETARESEPLGAPSGVMFAAFQAQGMSLDFYNQIIQALVTAGRITVSNNCVHAI